MRFKAVVLIIFMAAAVYADEYRDLMNRGEKQYRKREYPASADLYKQAEIVRPDDPTATFNNGAALYKSNDFEKAKERFAQAAAKSKDKVKAESYYNLGNTFYKSQDYASALGAYKDALTIDPKNQDAKFNFELAKKKLQEQKQQQQQQKQDQQKSDDKQKQNQQDQQNQQNQDQNKQDQNKDQQQQQDQQKQDKRDQQQQDVQAKPGEMNKQEAKQLLNAFKEDEKQVQEQLKKFKVRPSSTRDW